MPDESTRIILYKSKYTNFRSILLNVCQAKRIESRTVRIWNYESEKDCSLIVDLDATLYDENITYDQILLFERQKRVGVWPRDERLKSKLPFYKRIFNIIKGKEKVEDGKTDQSGQTNGSLTSFSKGLCGLRNLGNTCFMNSSLQCLSNTTLLRDYFIADTYKNDINKDNPIGMKGNVAENFGNLMKQMWSGEEPYVSPKALKQTIAKWAPQFEGFNQHDSQELLAFLLDGLHEDLNQVSEKPYIETKEANGRPDDVVALEAWEGYSARNRSVIIDLFHGQLKSTVKCPKCEKVSVTFDPFMYLSLPLTQENDMWIDIMVVLNSETYPRKLSLCVRKNGNISEIKTSIANYYSINEKDIILAQIDDGMIVKIYKDKDDSQNVLFDDVYAFYLSPQKYKSKKYGQVFHRRRTKTKIVSFGYPFLIDLSENLTGKQLYNRVWKNVSRFCCLYQDSDDENEETTHSHDDDDDDDGDILPVTRDPNDIPLDIPIHDLGQLPFKLYITNEKGKGDSWSNDEQCGILITYDNHHVNFPKDSSIALEWESTIYEKNFDAEEFDKYKSDKAKDSKPSNDKRITLEDCLELFTTNERLGKDDPWYCSICKKHRRAWKKFDIWKLPKVIVIHLKRFQFTKRSRSKLNYFVEYPITGLNLDRFVINPECKGYTYNLFAISNHIGGLSGGHYTSCAKNSSTNKWYLFDDTHVSPIKNIESLQSRSAYTLFYERVD